MDAAYDELRATVREVAHELNNLLAAMTGYAEFLADDLDPRSAQHGFALKILKGQEAAMKQVAKLLDASGFSEKQA